MTPWRAIPVMLLLAVLGASPSFGAQDAIVRRAAFDVGSSVIKCTVGDVNTADDTLVDVVEEFSAKVDFAEDLARSYDGNLSREVMRKGYVALEILRQKALKLQARRFAAVGGSAVRSARNGRAYFVTLQQKLGFPCRLVSEQQAALLNYHAARLQVEAPDLGLLVWDIGGDRQQMTLRNPDGSMTFYVDDLASVSFKNVVIRLLLGKDIATTASPNPMDARQVREALRYVRAHAGLQAPRNLIDRLRTGRMTVIGIGGVHYHSIPETMGEAATPYTRRQVTAALEKWTGKPDAAFDSEYAGTRLTNLILVLGYMEALGIETVSPIHCNEAHGLLVSPEYW